MEKSTNHTWTRETSFQWKRDCCAKAASWSNPHWNQ